VRLGSRSDNEADAASLAIEARKNAVWGVFHNFSDVLKPDELGKEIAFIALPAVLALAADPLASLVDTAFIGKIGTTVMQVLWSWQQWASQSRCLT